MIRRYLTRGDDGSELPAFIEVDVAAAAEADVGLLADQYGAHWRFCSYWSETPDRLGNRGYFVRCRVAQASLVQHPRLSIIQKEKPL